MNYQANDIAELKDRQANYSQNLKLPKTKNNTEIFGYANISDIKTNIPYRKLNCKVYYGVNTIAGEESFIIILQISDKFECQILSGNAGLFDILKNKPMSDLALPTILLITSNLHPQTFTEYHLFCISSFLAGKNTGVSMEAGALLPFAKMLPILGMILQNEDYTIESNILDEPEFKNCIMPAVFQKDNETDFSFLTGDAKTTYITGDAKINLYFAIQSNASGFFEQSNDTENSLIYTCPVPGIITLNIHVVKNNTNTWIDIVAFNKAGEYIYEYINKGEAYFESVEVELSYGDTIKLYAHSRNKIEDINLIDIKINILFKLSENTSTPFYGAKIPISGVGIKSQLDFIKAITQAFGLFVYVDKKNKTFKACTASFFYDQIKNENTLDWSKKVVKRKNEQKFTIESYAKKNYIRFIDNEADEASEEALIEIDDDTLEPDKELFKLPFEAGINKTFRRGGAGEDPVKAASIPIIEIGENNKRSIKTGKPHLCKTSDSTYNMNLGCGFNNYKAAEHIEPSVIKDKFYIMLETGILKDCLFTDEELLLTPQDIQGFDPFVPVYLEKYGAYFYINKIKNFVAGKTTKVELVRL
jgi:hypothetical protein